MKLPYFCCIGAELKRYTKDFDFMNQVYLYKVPTDDSIEEVLAEDYFKMISDSVLQDDIVYIYEANAETLHSCRFNKENGHITAVPLASDETLTGAVTSIIHDNLTKNRAVISNEDGKVAVSDVTSTELGYLSGAKSNIQEQLDNKANAYEYATNCITEIPQDINLTLSDGTLTLKAGSKVYVPNGSGVFDAYTVPSDLTNTPSAFSTSTNRMYVLSPNKLLNPIDTGAEYVYSGTTAPTTFDENGRAYWYDTTNNVIKRTADSGSNWVSGYSFPITIVDITNGVGVSKIDQVFNGFGYIGSKVFALPGVKGLVPDGRNADGTLKNAIRTISNVATADGYNSKYVIDQGGFGPAYYTNYAEQETQPSFENGTWYQPSTNIMYTIRNNVATKSAQVYAFDVKTSGGKITSLTPKTPFHAVDYNDTEFIANQAMPSERYSNLTLPATGGTITAQADGYLTVNKSATAAGQYINFINGSNGMNCNTIAPSALPLRLCMPVSKGDVITINYDAAGTTTMFRFIYANGSK